MKHLNKILKTVRIKNGKEVEKPYNHAHPDTLVDFELERVKKWKQLPEVIKLVSLSEFVEKLKTHIDIWHSEEGSAKWSLTKRYKDFITQPLTKGIDLFQNRIIIDGKNVKIVDSDGYIIFKGRTNETTIEQAINNEISLYLKVK